MTPVLYQAGETAFTTNGLGRLSEATACVVEEERNGKYELQMTYPVSGEHFQEIKHSRIIFAMPFDAAPPQPFRIYYISKPINGRITVRAEHISYQLSHIPVSPFTATACAEALQGLRTNAAEACPFSFWTDKTTAANFSVQVPSSIRSMLGGVRGSILDTYGGEYEFDRYTVKLHSSRGTDRGVTLRYGKNITDIRQEESIESTITGVYPFWKGADASGTESIVELDEKVLHSTNAANFPYQRTVPLDLSAEFGESAPTQAELRTRAQAYMRTNNVGVPSVSIKVSFIPLWQTEEYKEAANLERVRLCDTVTVQFPSLDISAAAKVVRTKFNVLTERYEEIELGDAKSNLGATLRDSIDAAGNGALQALRESSSALKREIARNTARITGADGGSIQFLFDANGKPTAIAALNTDSIDTATECLLINYAGLGGSQNGIAGPFISAITSDGHINADMITVGHILATLIRGGVLSLGGTESAGSFGNGVMKVYDAYDNLIGQWDKNGLTVKGAFKVKSGNYTMLECSDDTDVLKEVYGLNYNPHALQIGWAYYGHYNSGAASAIIRNFSDYSITPGEKVRDVFLRPANSNVGDQSTYIFSESVDKKEILYRNRKKGESAKLCDFCYSDTYIYYAGEYTGNYKPDNKYQPTGQYELEKIFCLNDDHFIAKIDDTTFVYISKSNNGVWIRANTNQYILLNNDGIKISGANGNKTLEIQSYATINGRNVAFESSSSRRYKHNIEHRLTKDRDPHNLLKIAPAQFVFNQDHKLQYPDMFGKTIPGLIAEEVAEVYPSAAICNPETGEIESWDERRIIPGMLALIQEQEKRINELENRLAKLEGAVNV